MAMGVKCEVINCKTGHNSERKRPTPHQSNHLFTQSTLDLLACNVNYLLYADVLIRILLFKIKISSTGPYTF